MSNQPVVDLDDDSALDSMIVGAKAARLAAARRAGLPVLPGVIVVAEVGRPALRRGAEALERGGSGRARLSAMDEEVPETVLVPLRAALDVMGTPVVVRSSSPMEGDTAWSGTFSSFEDIERDDLRTAVRGVWASAFTVHAVERYEAIGFDAADVDLAVLVQRQLVPECGGSARRYDDGRVAVHAIAGAPRDLLQGWETGVRAVVHPNDGPVEGDAVAALGADPIRAAADLVIAVHEKLGDDLIEWAWADGAITLLQSTSSPLAIALMTSGEELEGLNDPRFAEAAVLVERFPGPLGEQLVLPWAFAFGSGLPSPAPRAASADIEEDFSRAIELATQLTKQAWQDRADGGHQVVEAFAALRSSDPVAALDLLLATRRVDTRQASELLGLLDGIAVALAGAGRLHSQRRMWRATVDQIRAAVGDPERREPQSLGPDRWEPFLHAAVRANGTLTAGVPVVPGISAGRVVVVRDAHSPPPFEDRDVIVADRPLPALAPLLWRAGGLVTATGNPAAHLMEVANSVALPTVLGVDLTSFGGLSGLAASAWIAAVDGDAGTVSFLPTVVRHDAEA